MKKHLPPVRHSVRCDVLRVDATFSATVELPYSCSLLWLPYPQALLGSLLTSPVRRRIVKMSLRDLKAAVGMLFLWS